MAPSSRPRVDSFVTLSDGRRLAYSEWADPHGQPMVLLHGSPGSRLRCPDLDATIAAGVRLLTVDRPGYGRSDPLPGRTTVGIVADLIQLLDFLDLPTCPVVGESGGGGYALACGWAEPGRFPRVALAAAPGPRSEMPAADSGLSDLARGLRARLRAGDATVEKEVREQFAFYAEDPRSFLSEGLKGPDAQMFADPAMVDALGTMWEEGARQGVEGLYSDWVAGALGWGFPLEEVLVPVHIWHGVADNLVGVNHAAYLAERLPDSRVDLIPGVGHSVADLRWGDIMSGLS